MQPNPRGMPSSIRATQHIPSGSAPDRRIPGPWLTGLTRFQEYLSESEAPERERVAVLLKDGELQPLENMAAQAGDGFQLASADAYLVTEYGDVLFHDHPNGDAYPSARDLAWVQNYPRAWCVVPAGGDPFWFGDGVPSQWPLEGRPFRYGVTDCFTLLRAALLGYGISLRPRAYRWGWWAAGERLYDEYFTEEGFTELQGAQPRPGDVYLMSLKADVSNHAALYVGHGEIIHHPSAGQPYEPSWLSRREPVAPYLRARFRPRHLRHMSLQ